MTKRIVQPIRARIVGTGKQTQDALSDIWSSLSGRIAGLGAQYEKIESQNKRAFSLNEAAARRILKIGESLESELPVQQAAVEMLLDLQRGIVEVARIISEEGEVLSQSVSDSALAAADLAAAGKEIERATQGAKEGRYDAANLETVTREGKLFVTDDPATIGAMLDEVDKAKFIQALKERDEDSWQRAAVQAELLAARTHQQRVAVVVPKLRADERLEIGQHFRVSKQTPERLAPRMQRPERHEARVVDPGLLLAGLGFAP
jgi:hypothetical protein